MAALASDPLVLRRAGAAALVLALHAILVALLIHSKFLVETPAAVRERIYWLTLRENPKPIVPRVVAVPRPRATTHLPAKKRAAPSAPAAKPGSASPGADSLNGLQLNLFGCALENLANLTPEQRAQCTSGLKTHDGNSIDYADHTSRTHDAQRWARDVARKKNPLLLPCANPGAINPVGTAFCLANGVLNGFDVDNSPGYEDQPSPPDHVPNNGDPADPLKR